VRRHTGEEVRLASQVQGVSHISVRSHPYPGNWGRGSGFPRGTGEPIAQRTAHRYIQAKQNKTKKRRYRLSALVLKLIKPKGSKDKGNNTLRAPFFFCMCWHGTSKQHFRSKKIAPRSWWFCSATASGSRGQSSNSRGGIPPPTPDFFPAVLAGEFLVVSTHCGPVWRQAELTDAIHWAQ
jgi:hypothetical protein